MRRDSLFRRAVSAVIVVHAVTLFSVDANAISRYTATSMTCASIKAAIRNQGAVILRSTSPRTGNTISNRYVANGNYCLANQITRSTSVRASNTRNCGVYYCVSRRAHDPFD
jgi:hypothetical protein